jgi:predicted GIY-YIG superfamily endonuclease
MRAVADKIPLYCVFGDTVIKSIAQTMPGNASDLVGIRGLTVEKRELYGSDILDIVERCRALPPARGCDAKPPIVARHARRVSGFDPWTRRGALLKTFDSKRRKPLEPVCAAPLTGNQGVYVLELAQGRVYVGYSADVRSRIRQHMAGQGAAFTRAFPPTGVILPRLGRVSGSPEAAERDETLRYMFLRGIKLVRGWKYVQVEMKDEEEREAESNIRELYDLCRRCGFPGHFVSRCTATFDRHGRPC